MRKLFISGCPKKEMNVQPRSERAGNVVHMSAPQAGRDRVRLSAPPTGGGNDMDSDEDEEFMALMNSDKSKEPAAPPPFSQSGGLPGGLPTMDAGALPPLGASPPPMSRQSSGGSAGGFGPPGAGGGFGGEGSSGYGGEAAGGGEASSFRSLEEEKQHFIYKIQRLQARYPGRRVGLETPLDELKYEYERLKRQSELSASIKFQRRTLMAAVTGIEFLNKSFNPLGLHLDGWSEQMMDSLEDYDQTFEQLHEKYQGTAEVSPEWNLMMMVLGSGFMFHLSNSLFKSVLPNVNEVARNNPDLMNQIASAMGNAMGQQQAPTGNPTQMGAGLAMQAMQNQLRPNETPSIEEASDIGSSDVGSAPPGFEQAAALVQPGMRGGPSMPTHTRDAIEELSSSASDASSDVYSEEGETRAVRGTKRPPPKKASGGRGSKKNKINLSL